MSDYTELRAEKRKGPDIDRDKLRRLAEKARVAQSWVGRGWVGDAQRAVLTELADAANPAVVLSLLDELEATKAELATRPPRRSSIGWGNKP